MAVTGNVLSGGVTVTSGGVAVTSTRSSYNSLIATAVLDMPLQDDAASTVVVNNAGTDGTLAGGDNTADISTTGPRTWLPKALDLDGTADYVDISAAALSFTDGEPFSVSAWINYDSGTWVVTGRAGDANSRISGDSTRVFVRVAGSLTFSGFTINALTSYHVLVTRNASNQIRVFINAVESSSGAQSGPFTFEPNALGRLSTSYSNSRNAGLLVLPTDESANVSELYAGPEPTYTSGATIADNGAYDVGTWDAQSNGTATYEWVVVEADGTVVDSGTGATGTADFGATTGLLTLLVRASNDGGYDVGDYATRTAGYGSAGDGYYEVATVEAAKSITAETGTFTLTGNPTFRRAETGTFTLTGNNTDLRTGYKLTAAVGAFTLAGQTTGLQATRLLQADPQQYNLTGFGAEFDYNGLNSYHLDSLPGTFLFTGNDLLFELTLRYITAPHIATLSKPITVHEINKPITVYTIPVE